MKSEEHKGAQASGDSMLALPSSENDAVVSWQVFKVRMLSLEYEQVTTSMNDMLTVNCAVLF